MFYLIFQFKKFMIKWKNIRWNRKEEPKNTKIKLFDKNGKNLDKTYKKIISNALHGDIFDKDGNN